MKIIKNSLLNIAVVLSVMIIFLSFVFADTADDKTQIDKVRASVESSFKSFIPSLEVDKKNFGLNASETYSSADLGDGIPYYVLSKDLIDKGRFDADAFTLGGYLFPIKVNGKTTGMATANKDSSGKWTVTQISNQIDLEEKVADAEKLFKDSLPTKLIYDRGFSILAVAGKTESGYGLVPIIDNDYWGMKKNEINSLDAVGSKVIKQYKEFKQQRIKDYRNIPAGGAGSGGSVNKHKTLHNLILPSAIALIILVVGSSIFIVYFKRRKS